MEKSYILQAMGQIATELEALDAREREVSNEIEAFENEMDALSQEQFVQVSESMIPQDILERISALHPKKQYYERLRVVCTLAEERTELYREKREFLQATLSALRNYATRGLDEPLYGKEEK